MPPISSSPAAESTRIRWTRSPVSPPWSMLDARNAPRPPPCQEMYGAQRATHGGPSCCVGRHGLHDEGGAMQPHRERVLGIAGRAEGAARGAELEREPRAGVPEARELGAEPRQTGFEDRLQSLARQRGEALGDGRDIDRCRGIDAELAQHRGRQSARGPGHGGATRRPAHRGQPRAGLLGAQHRVSRPRAGSAFCVASATRDPVRRSASRQPPASLFGVLHRVSRPRARRAG